MEVDYGRHHLNVLINADIRLALKTLCQAATRVVGIYRQVLDWTSVSGSPPAGKKTGTPTFHGKTPDPG